MSPSSAIDIRLACTDPMPEAPASRLFAHGMLAAGCSVRHMPYLHWLLLLLLPTWPRFLLLLLLLPLVVLAWRLRGGEGEGI